MLIVKLLMYRLHIILCRTGGCIALLLPTTVNTGDAGKIWGCTAAWQLARCNAGACARKLLVSHKEVNLMVPSHDLRLWRCVAT